MVHWLLCRVNHTAEDSQGSSTHFRAHGDFRKIDAAKGIKPGRTGWENHPVGSSSMAAWAPNSQLEDEGEELRVLTIPSDGIGQTRTFAVSRENEGKL